MMSEEEIINNVEDFIEYNNIVNRLIISETRFDTKVYISKNAYLSIINLLELYNKEKEKNKELFETCCRYEDTLGHYECKVFEELDDYIKLDKLKELEEIGIKRKKYFSKEYLEEKFINKDKIKEKIKELEKEYNKYTGYKGLEFSRTGLISSQIQVLKQLLGR